MNDPSDDRPKILVGSTDDAELPPGMVQHTNRSPDAPARVDRTPVIVDDPAELARTKAIYEQESAELYKHAIATIGCGEYVYSECLAALKAHRERAIVDLRAILTNQKNLPKARTKAAETLITLGRAEGEAFLLDQLQSKSAADCLAALESLREWLLPIDLTGQERARSVLTLLSDPHENVALAAAQLCQYRNIPGAEAELTRLLENNQYQNPTSMAMELAEIASTKRAVDALLPHVLNDSGTNGEFRQWTGYSFNRLIDNKDPEISSPVRKKLYEYTLRFPEQRYDQTLVEFLAKSADTAAIPVLQDIVKQAHDPVSQMYAVRALTRLRPEQAVDLLLEQIERLDGRSFTFHELRGHVQESDFAKVAALLEKHLSKPGKSIDTDTAHLFLVDFGTPGQQFIQQHFEELDEHARMVASWKLAGLNLHSALEELFAAGVINLSPVELIAQMEQARDPSEPAEPVDISDPHILVAALSQAGVLIMFDTESDVIPSRHDRLIEEFAEASNHRLTPLYPIQKWHQQNEDDYDAPYTVQFAWQNRLFRIGAENYGDWYDVVAVQTLLNFALETTGQPERYLALETGDQTASFVFADPAAFIPIANKYKLPLSSDASLAMRAGIEFENLVRERIKP